MNDSSIPTLMVLIVMALIVFIRMVLIGILCMYVYLNTRNVECRLKDKNDDDMLSIEPIKFNDIVLETILSNLSYKKQYKRTTFSLLIPVTIFSIYGILYYFGADMRAFVTIYSILFFFST